MAKRVNTRFLLLLTAMVVLGGMGLMAARFVLPRLWRHDPHQLAREALELEKAGRPDEAIVRHQAAVRAAMRDPTLRVSLGDLYNRHVNRDPQNLGKAREAWAGALSVDPANRDALHRLLDAAWAMAQHSTRAETLNKLREAAERVLAVDPSDRVARTRLLTATVRAVESDVPTRPEDLQAAATGLRELAGQDPADAEAAWWAGRAELQLAEASAAAGDDLPAARRRMDELEKVVDAMHQGQPANAAVQFRAAQLYVGLSELDKTVNPRPRAQRSTPAATQPRAGRFTDRVGAALAAARAAVKPADEHYADVMLVSAEWLAAVDKTDESHKLLDEMIAARPQDVKARLGYGRLLGRDPARRARALEVLDVRARPVDTSDATGVEVMRRKEAEGALLLELAKVRMAAFDEEPDAAKRKATLGEARADVAALEAAVGGQAVPVMELKGRIALADGRLADAIALLQPAVDRRGEAGADYDIIYRLARAYLDARQTGQAEKLLQRVVARYPADVPARALLIRTLLADGQPDAARLELAELKRRKPEAPEVAELTAAVEGGKTRQAFVEQMPEKTAPEKVNKARNLRREGKAEEAAELARAAFKDEPTYMPAVELLLDLYLAGGRREEAVALADEALAANPGDARLTDVTEQLARRTRGELDAWRLERIAAEPDAFARELKLFDFHFDRALAAAAAAASSAEEGDDADAGATEAPTAPAATISTNADAAAAKAAAHLDAAERLKPDDLGVASRRFELLLVRRRFDDAAGAIAKLAAADTDGAGGAVLRFRLAAARGDMAGAEAAAREMIGARPQFAEGHERLGQVLQAQGRHREALDAFTDALERQGRNYAALRGAIQAHDALEEGAEAKAVLDRARALFPNDPAFREMSLNHDLRQGDAARAVADRERLLRENPEQPGHALLLAEAYLFADARRREQPGRAPKPQRPDQNDPATAAALAKARKVLEDGAAKWPEDERFWMPLARVIDAQGDFGEGERVLQSFTERQGTKGTAAADLLMSRYYGATGKPAQAEQKLRDAVAKSKEPAETAALRSRLAAMLAESGRRADAARELEGVPGPGAAHQRVLYLLGEGRADEAMAAVNKAVEANPDADVLASLHVQMLIDAARFDEARAAIDRRRGARGDADEAVRFFGAMLKLRAEPPDVAGATAELTELVNRNPRHQLARVLLAEAHMAGNDAGPAIAELGRVLESAPAERDVRLKLIEWCAGAKRWDTVLKLAAAGADQPATAGDAAWPKWAARAYAALGKVDDAERTITSAIARAAAPAQAGALRHEYLAILLGAERFAKVLEVTKPWLAEAKPAWWVHQARGLALQSSDPKAAEREFDAALGKLDPVEQFAEAEQMVATVAKTLGREVAIERVSKWTDRDVRWRVIAADLHMANGDAAGAVKEIGPALAGAADLEPQVRASVYRTAAMAYHQLQPAPDHKRAVALYEQFLELKPKDALILNNVAYLLAEEQKPADPIRAKAYSQRAYDIAKNWRPGEPRARVLDTHGWVLVLNGEVGEGVRVLEEVLEESPLVEVHYHLAEAHLRENRADEAREHLDRALAMIAKAKETKKRADPQVEQRVRDAMERAKRMEAAAAG